MISDILAGEAYVAIGLRVAFARQLVELLWGTIGVESEVAKGSTFTARFPV